MSLACFCLPHTSWLVQLWIPEESPISLICTFLRAWADGQGCVQPKAFAYKQSRAVLMASAMGCMLGSVASSMYSMERVVGAIKNIKP